MMVLLVRHGEAAKNLEARHGTVDASLSVLTPKGLRQAERLAAKLETLGRRFEKIHHTQRSQCRNTAQAIAGGLGAAVELWNNIPPYHLGILEGLSDSEVDERFPVLGAMMRKYRDGQTELSEVSIPGATNPSEYFAVASAAVRRQLQRDSDFALVASRSVLIAFASVLLGRSPIASGGYREIPWPNCGVLAFDVPVLFSPPLLPIKELSTVAV